MLFMTSVVMHLGEKGFVYVMYGKIQVVFEAGQAKADEKHGIQLADPPVADGGYVSFHKFHLLRRTVQHSVDESVVEVSAVIQIGHGSPPASSVKLS